MAESSWPAPTYNSGAVSNAEFEAMNYYVGGGLIGLHTETAPIFADSSGRQIKIRAERRANIHGYTWYSGSSDTTVALAANASGSTRLDRIVLRLTRSTWTVRVAVVQGTPGAGVPALTQTYADTGVFEITLAVATVVNNATILAPSDVVSYALYFAPSQMVAGVSTATPVTANATTRAFAGQVYLDATTGTLRYHNGSTVRQLADGVPANFNYENMLYPPMCRLLLNANFSVANNSNAVSVPFASGSEQMKTHAALHSTTVNNTRIIANVAGIWEFKAVTTFAPNTTGFRTHTIGLNGVRQAPEAGIYNAAALPVGANATLPPVICEIPMQVNDYAELFAYQNSGGALNIVGTGSTTNTGNTVFSGRYLRPLP